MYKALFRHQGRGEIYYPKRGNSCGHSLRANIFSNHIDTTDKPVKIYTEKTNNTAEVTMTEIDSDNTENGNTLEMIIQNLTLTKHKND